MNIPESSKAAFVDINVFAEEGFTNGIFITIREIFHRFEALGIPSAILSVSQASETSDIDSANNLAAKIQKKRAQNVDIHELALKPSLTNNPELYMRSIQALISDFKPTLVFVNTPAVFFEPTHIQQLETVINSGAKVVVLLADALFPTEAKHPTKDVQGYYRLFDKVEVIATSQRLQELFLQDTGLTADFFPNIFTTADSKIAEGSHDHITLVNHHPVKGREVFDAVAKKLPNKKFLVVETWPDVPPYVPPGDNVTFSKFIPDVRDLYRKTKILLIPSLYEEGPARIITEAMINGIPVIAHRIGCLPEVGQEYIFYVDPPEILRTDMVGTVLYPRVSQTDINKTADKFIELIEMIDKDPETWQKYSAAARTYAEEYCRQVEDTFSEYVTKWFS